VGVAVPDDLITFAWASVSGAIESGAGDGAEEGLVGGAELDDAVSPSQSAVDAVVGSTSSLTVSFFSSTTGFFPPILNETDDFAPPPMLRDGAAFGAPPPILNDGAAFGAPPPMLSDTGFPGLSGLVGGSDGAGELDEGILGGWKPWTDRTSGG